MAPAAVFRRRGATESRSAFTLIELLIVVAIIAILAAIAVPNFLEAQTRSKVSRGKADMRTIATAIESYRVDTNRLPLSTADSPTAAPPPIYQTPATMLRYAWMVSITTPIAYLTTIPKDPFGGQKDPYPDDLRFYLDYRRTIRTRSNFTQQTTIKEVSTGIPAGARNDPTVSPDSFILWSVGPDKYQNINSGTAANGSQVYGFGDPVGVWCVYDSTNGTSSWGDIVRSTWGDERAIIGL